MNHLEDLHLDVIKLAYDKGPVSGSCEHGNETSVSVRYQEILGFICLFT